MNSTNIHFEFCTSPEMCTDTT